MFKLSKSSESDVVQSTKQPELTQLQKNQSTVKDIIAPGGVDASYTNHIGIISSKTRYARSMIVSALPRMCTFPEFLRGMYTFGDINVSVFISPLSESSSQTDFSPLS